MISDACTLPRGTTTCRSSAIIRVGLQRADALGISCYLESSNARDVPFYEHHGFVIVEEYYHFEPVNGDKGPVMFLMLRKSRSE